LLRRSDEVLKFKVFQGSKAGLATSKNARVAVERAADEATRWMNSQGESVVIAHVAAASPGEFHVAHVVVWYEDAPR